MDSKEKRRADFYPAERRAWLAHDLKRLIEKCGDDPETVHLEMDKLMVKELRALGYNEAMDIFERQEKWYE